MRSILVSTNLAAPSIDTFYLRFLRKMGIAPVVLVHKPYRNFFEDTHKEKAYRYKKFYEAASLILVMTKYTADQLWSLYDLPKDKFYSFKFPHHQPLLSRYKTSLTLLKELEKWHEGVPVISFFSQLSFEHGFENFMESLPFLNKVLPEYKLVIVSRLSNRHHRNGIIDKLTKYGLNDLYKCNWDSYSYATLKAYLKITTVTILPYNFATQSQVLPMSSGMGIPIVATSVGGLPEMIKSGVNGELVPPNKPLFLAEAINHVVKNVGSYRQKSKDYAEQEFSPSNAAKSIKEALSRASL